MTTASFEGRTDGYRFIDGVPTIQVSEIHQIEITSRCNLRCPYCVHPTMKRAKEDMTEETFRRALHWVKHFVTEGIRTPKGTIYQQRELNLAGIGESTIHPEFVRFIHIARETLGQHVWFVLATNGINMTPELAGEIAAADVTVAVSLHRPEKAGPAIEMLKRAKVEMLDPSNDPATKAMNWAGQVDWFVSAPQPRPCHWIQRGGVFVLSDGRIARCCLDGKGEEVLGHVNDDVSKMRTSPYSLCPSCDQNLEIKGWNQQMAKPLPMVL